MKASKTFYFSQDNVDYTADVQLVAYYEADYLCISLEKVLSLYEDISEEEIEVTDELIEFLEDLIDNNHKSLANLFERDNN